MLVTIDGDARTMLSAERPALNFIQTLSAVATHTRRYVDAIAGLPAKILDTRKTLPQAVVPTSGWHFMTAF